MLQDIANRGRYIGGRKHIKVAEKALGHRLPPKAEVHHVNGIRDDNRNTNLVICENRSYHRLLHVRTEALRDCGHVDWRKCKFCKQYAPVANLQMGITRTNGYEPAPYHQQCQTDYRTVWRRSKGIKFHMRLTEKQVRAIRKQKKTLTTRQLMKEYGASKSCICGVVSGRSWSSIPLEG